YFWGLVRQCPKHAGGRRRGLGRVQRDFYSRVCAGAGAAGVVADDCRRAAAGLERSEPEGLLAERRHAECLISPKGGGIVELRDSGRQQAGKRPATKSLA